MGPEMVWTTQGCDTSASARQRRSCSTAISGLVQLLVDRPAYLRLACEARSITGDRETFVAEQVLDAPSLAEWPQPRVPG